MEPMITPDLVVLDEDLGDQPQEVVRALTERLAAVGRVTDVDAFVDDVMEREAKASTGQKGGIAIPHCRSSHVATGSLGFARLSRGADFSARDGSEADLVFLLAAAEGGDADHMKLLTQLARGLVRKEFTSALREAETADDVVRIIRDRIEPKETVAAASSEGPDESSASTETRTSAADDERPLLVAITACATGIAHTYMAADSLEQAAERAGARIAVETQGSSGATRIDRAMIEQASAVIFAADVGIRDRQRFAGMPMVRSGTKRAIDDADAMIEEALAAADNPNAARVEGNGADAQAAAAATGDVHFGEKLRQWLMTGVSYMIPFVAAGGLLIALGFLLGGYDLGRPDEDLGAVAQALTIGNSLWNLPEGGILQYLGAVFFQLGSLAFAFLVPALAGYIAYAIADRPGIAPGFVVGQVATFVGAGFIGGLVGGLLAGAVALWISRRDVPDWARGLMPVVVIPLGATLIAGGLMFLVLGQPLAAATRELEAWLGGLSGESAILLGLALGAMMAFDMGGPVNKAAYTFAAAGLGGAATAAGDAPELVIMAAVMGAGMVPPLALALATVLRPSLFTPPERENGKAAWLLGASFITEGAIPFAAADPIRVIPSIVLGSAVTGAIITSTSTGLRAPHGGIFVLFAIEGVVTFLIALAVGTVISAAAVIAAKSFHRDADEAEATPATAV